MPPLAFRNALRGRVAAELLCRTEWSVGQIAEQVGYSTPSDFYRAFCQLYGMSPSEYRKKQRE